MYVYCFAGLPHCLLVHTYSCQPSWNDWDSARICPMSQLCPRLPDLLAMSWNTARLHKWGSINLVY